MANQKQFRILSTPQARTDGSGAIDHDMEVVWSADDGDTWHAAKHKTVSIPASVLDAALAQATNPQKVAAYKQAIRDHAFFNPTPQTPPVLGEWEDANIDQFIADYVAWEASKGASDSAASSTAQDVAIFADGFGGFPVQFNL